MLMFWKKNYATTLTVESRGIIYIIAAGNAKINNMLPISCDSTAMDNVRYENWFKNLG